MTQPPSTQLPPARFELAQKLCALLPCLVAAVQGAVYAAEGNQLRASTLDQPFFETVDFSGQLAAEYRYFPEPPLRPEPLEHHNVSAALEPALFLGWGDGWHSFTLKPFGRIDQHDDQRSHADIREGFYRYAGENFEVRAGFRKLFWGKVESVNRVDVINQTDFVEDIGGGAKLGQPMLDASLFLPLGTLDLLVMPYFRERTFPSEEGRPNTLVQIRESASRYENDKRERHIDLALRYSGSLAGVDFGLSLFRGTRREPRFNFAFDACSAQLNLAAPVLGVPLPPATASCQADAGPLLPLIDQAVQSVDVSVDNPYLIPIYDQSERAGLELQYLLGNLFLKLEAAREHARFEDFTAVTAGFEYSFADVFGSGWNVTAATEYLYDSRGQLNADLVRAADQLGRTGQARFDSIQQANELRTGLRPGSAAAFDNDVFAGARIDFNDLRGSSLTLGAIVDADTGATVGRADFGRRLTGSLRASISLRLFADIPPTDPIYSFRQDDYLQLELAQFF